MEVKVENSSAVIWTGETKQLFLDPMTNIDIVQMLANGFTTQEIAKEYGTTAFYVGKKVKEARERCLCKTYGQLIAVYFRKKLIE